jgi:predicted RNase H-like HicB family nuclease
MNYPVIIRKDINSDYGVEIPDLPGCFSAGSSIDEAIENTREAILFHIEGLIEDNETIPGPSKIENFKSKTKNAVLAIVNVDISELYGKTKRINVSFPDRILNKVDKFAKKNGESRSGILVNAAIEYMSSHSKDLDNHRSV